MERKRAKEREKRKGNLSKCCTMYKIVLGIDAVAWASSPSVTFCHYKKT